MAITDMVSKVAGGIPTPSFCSHVTKESEKLSAAKALPRNPDKVMATWMVAKKLDGLLVSFFVRIADLFPSSANFASRFSFIVMNAISALAKIAFNSIKISCNKSCHNNVVFTNLSPYNKSFLLVKNRKMLG